MQEAKHFTSFCWAIQVEDIQWKNISHNHMKTSVGRFVIQKTLQSVCSCEDWTSLLCSFFMLTFLCKHLWFSSTEIFKAYAFTNLSKLSVYDRNIMQIQNKFTSLGSDFSNKYQSNNQAVIKPTQYLWIVITLLALMNTVARGGWQRLVHAQGPGSSLSTGMACH